MGTTITLDKRHFKVAARKARELGQTPESFIESLIDASAFAFDEILAPVRKGFEKSGVTENELDGVVAQARKAIHSKSRRKSRK